MLGRIGRGRKPQLVTFSGVFEEVDGSASEVVRASIIWHRSQSKHMRNHLLNRRRRDLLTIVLLTMLLFRAYVPVGFMPANGTPFLVELCPAIAPVPMSMPMPAHHHHADTGSHFENCPFGSATAAGP